MKHSNLCKLIASTFSIAFLTSSNVHAAPDDIYLEADGYLHFEAENAGIPADWILATEINGYRGTGYLEWAGPNYFSKNNAGNGVISYQIRIETAGNYEFRWRSRIAKGDSNTESNDSWARFTTGANVSGEEPLNGWTKIYMGESDTWSWSSRTVDEVARPIRQFFSPGDHTIEISGRSNGHAIDQIALYRYEEVSFDPALNNTLPLSEFIQSDGMTIDPNPVVIPSPEVTLDERDNVVPITTSTDSDNIGTCQANTLRLAATHSASASIVNQAPDYDYNELLLDADRKTVLLTYELSGVPVFSNAQLMYTTGSQVSNGAIAIHLGSHSAWISDADQDIPNPTVQIATARGGWNNNSTYSSQLDASLLPAEQATIILAAQSGSESLTLAKASDESLTPTLLLSGGNNFCSEWEANLAEQEQELPEDVDSATVTRKSKSGSVAHWFALLILLGLMGRGKNAR
ncbi:MAG: hypothetical protein AB8B79_05440 [Granulosicoccus sp.]